MHYDDFIIKLDKQLQESNCHIWRKPLISDSREVALFATQIHWNIVRIPVHLFVDFIAEPKPADFQRFSEEGLEYGKRAYSSELLGLKLLVSSLAIIPCIVCEKALPETISYVTTREAKGGWKVNSLVHGLDIYPVLYCLSNNRTYHWTGKSTMRSAVWPYSRRLVEGTLAAITSTPHSNAPCQPPHNSTSSNHDNGQWWEGQNSA